MSILIRTIRVCGFRGLENLEIDLEPTTVLTGINNSGKTSFLKALQIVFGNRLFISTDDFNISEKITSKLIVIDVEIVPVDNNGKQVATFDENWEILFTENRIVLDSEGNQLIPLRTNVQYDNLKGTFKTTQHIQQEWVPFKDEKGDLWYQSDNGTEIGFHLDELPFFYMDAQRDILDDLKSKNSYLGKMVSKIEYSEKDIKTIERQIKELNEQAVKSSDVLNNIETTLKELDSALDSTGDGVNITPFPKKVRDLNRGISIQYSDFAMEYHGMGTRSWSSLLTLKSFISLFDKNSKDNETVFFPILAIEEPEAHLHPNAQKKLYNQISKIKGQKIISTHSPYIAASASLGNLRSFTKQGNEIEIGKLNTRSLAPEEIRKINRQVVKSRGEILFSKIAVFMEGETEEQALPIFAHKFFGCSHCDIGIDFIGVGGHNYKPFIAFADSLMIPWVIFSDAEDLVKANVQSQFAECTNDKVEADYVIYQDDGNNFEKQILDDGFEDEIKDAISSIELPLCHRPEHEQEKKREITAYNNEQLYEILTHSKTQYGPAVAEAICNSGKELPTKIIELFNKIEQTLKSPE